MNQQPPPGFYPDSQGVQRWWDGSQWTAEVKPVTAPDPDKTQVRPAQPRTGGAPAGAWQPQNQPLQHQQQHESQPQNHAQSWPVHQQAPGAPKKSRTPLIIAAVAALVLLIGGGILTAVLVTGGDDDKPDDVAGPEDTVEAYIQALHDDDCEGMVEQVTDKAAQKPSMDCSTFDDNHLEGVDTSYEIVDSSEDGDTAEVTSRESYQGDGFDLESECAYDLVKVDDVWLIDEADCTKTN